MVELESRLREKWLNWRAIEMKSGWSGEPSRGKAAEMDSRLEERLLNLSSV